MSRAVAFALLAGATVAHAGPSGEQVVAGQASIARAGNNTLITQSSERAAINWQNFNIGAAEAVRFAQPATSSVTLNRVLGQNPTEILGSLSANGQVFIVNPNGVLFGKSAQVDVGGLVASTLNLGTEDFMAGRYRFSADSLAGAVKAGSVTNLGNILANGGYIALIGPSVKNEGNLIANNGSVALAAGDSVTVNLNGNKLLGLSVEQGTLNSLADNKGLIKADGGQAILTATAADQLIKAVVNNDGIVEANTLTEVNGVIRLDGGMVTNTGALRANGSAGGNVSLKAHSLLNNSGILQASGTAGNGGSLSLQADVIVHTGVAEANGTYGGAVKLSGRNILLSGNATANATAGVAGIVEVHSSGRLLQTAQSTLSADAANGPGGQVIVSADQSLMASGKLSAIGDGMGGGGKITVLGKDIKLLAAEIEASGQYGGGEILIGGDYQGGNPAIANARSTIINHATHIRADAKIDGGGGKVVAWSDQTTQFDGMISARGGISNGNGGFVEVSSKGNFSFNGAIDAGATRGLPGKVLFDPKNIVIDSTGVQLDAVSLLADPNPGPGEHFGVGEVAVTVLPNNNIVVTDKIDSFAASNAGAVYLFSGSNGALISSLVGGAANDAVGNGGATVLTNGNYVVKSPQWANGSMTNAGSVTWGSGVAGISGVVSAANSLVGDYTNARVGDQSIVALPNGNYVVSTTAWNNGTATNAGAITWGNGAGGTVGSISQQNSLVGSAANEFVGTAVTVLANSNYVVSSPSWGGRVGAVTWGNGAGGTTGPVSVSNSLIGSAANDFIGSSNVTALTNGNYVVGSGAWNGNRGAATWGNGSTGIVGTVTAQNSLVGSTPGDAVGRVTALANGHYVVSSPQWSNGGVEKVGAVTWANGNGGTLGAVSTSNSLVGSTALDQVGNSGVTALKSGNYVVSSSSWNGGFGAATWRDGTLASGDTVSGANSLVGTSANDFVSNNGVIELTNGNYVVVSPNWRNGAVEGAGAVTWGNGATGISGAVSSVNSLIGSQPFDRVGTGSGRIGLVGVVPLDNGNYVVISDLWNNGAIARAGAVTWGSGTQGVSGLVSSTNSLVGNLGQFGRQGSFDIRVTPLSNGNYVVSSPQWTTGSNAYTGTVTWANGTTGIAGIATAANSLVGSHGNDFVGNGSATALANGNYVVRSPSWNGGLGAATWGNGNTGIIGPVTAANSLVGSTQFDEISSGDVTALPDGNYVVNSPRWNNIAGAVSWGNGASGISGSVSAANSLVGGVPFGLFGEVKALPNSSYVVSVRDAGSNGVVTGTGTVYLVTRSGQGQTFNTAPAATTTISPKSIASILATGVALTLQANNDITVNNAIAVNSPLSTAGNLTLQAGRSILLSQGVTTGNGNLTLIGNDMLASGVVDANRDPGNAEIAMASGAAINAGSGVVSIELRDGAGKTNSGSGDIKLNSITAGAIRVVNQGLGTGNVVINSGSTLSASNAGLNGLVLAAASGGNFINNSGAGALRAAAGRWQVWSTNPANDIRGGLAYDFKVYGATFGSTFVPRSANGLGNVVLYTLAPTITPVLSGFVAKTYDGNNAATLSVSNLIGMGAVDGDSVALSGTGTYDNRNAGIGKAVTATNIVASATNGAAQVFGYRVSGNSATASIGTINPRPITVMAFGDAKTYDGTTESRTIPLVTSGFVPFSGDTPNFMQSFDNRNAGSNKILTPSGVVNDGNGGNNYAVTFVANATGVIAKRPITVAATIDAKTYDGSTTSTAVPTITAGTLAAIGSDTTTFSQSFDSRNAGSNKTLTPAGVVNDGNGGANYAYTFATNTAGVIIPATIAAVTGITANDKVYDASTAATLNTAAAAFSGRIGADALNVATARGAFNDPNAGGGKTVAITGLSLDGPDAANYTLANTTATAIASISTRPISLSANNASKTYGNADPAFAYSVGGQGLAGTDAITNVISGALVRAVGESVAGGPYAINKGTLAANANYAITGFTPGQLTITPRPLIITADDKTRFVGNPLPPFGASYSGFAFTDTPASLTGTLAFATPATRLSPPGVYPIVPSGQSSANYTISYVDGALTVTSAELPPAVRGALSTVGARDAFEGGSVHGAISSVLARHRFDSFRSWSTVDSPITVMGDGVLLPSGLR